MTVRLTAAIPVFVITLAASPAFATLGAAYNSVQTDRAHFAAQIRSTPASTHTVHALTLPNRGVVNEYTRPDGTVFAVTWHGPGRPDLRQLLGGYFDTMQVDNVVRAGPRRRRPLAVNRPNLVIQSGGHSGAFWGVALLPNEKPAGFSASDLK